MRGLVPGGYVFTHAVFWTVLAMVGVGTMAVPMILGTGLAFMVLESLKRS